jgi:hypothetical protein
MRKRTIILLLSLLSVLNSFAQGFFESDSIRYQLNTSPHSPKNVRVVSLINDRYKGDIEIPAYVVFDGVEYAVKEIDAEAFYGCREMTSVSIPEGITRIGDFAFGECERLTEVTIPKSVKTIGSNAFTYCTNLSSVTISEGVESIYYDAFRNCRALTSVNIPSSVRYFDSNPFPDCINLTSITVDSGNQIFDSRNNCNAIIHTESNTLVSGCKNTVIPQDVTGIGVEAFSGCSSLSEIDIPSGVKYLGYYAFSGCERLSSVTIPDNVTIIGNYCFSYSGLTSINIPSGITSIGDGSFAGCHHLDSIKVDSENSVYDSRGGCNAIIETETNALIAGCNSTVIPQDICSISDQALMGCINLKNVSIPASVNHIGYDALRYCYNLESITVATGNTVYDSRNNCNAIIETQTNSLVYGCKSTVIPQDITYIASSAFEGCQGLESISIPGNIEEIGDYAFEGCQDLKSVVISQGIKEIGFYAFGACFNLSSVDIPGSVERIESDAFYCCRSLASVTIPETVDYIGGEAFYMTPWYDSMPDGIIYINKTLYGYKGAMPQNTVINIKEGTKHIANYAFESCANLKAITIPNSVISLGDYAFAGCSSLKSVIIPSGITFIPNDAFCGCSSLEWVVIPDGVTQIGSNAFRGCLKLKSIVFPEGVKDVYYKAFDGCTGLKSISIPSTLENWAASNMLNNCNGIDTVYWNHPYFSATMLGSNSQSIKYIEFGDSVKSFSNESNYNNDFSELTAVTFCSKDPSRIQISEYFFKAIDYDNCALYVPYGARYEYTYSIPWSKFNNIVATDRIEHGTVVDGIRYEITSYQDRTVSVIHNDYSGSVKIPTIVMIDGIQYTVTKIETEAFSDCTELVKIRIPQSVTSLVQRTFENCTSLTDVFFEYSPNIEKNVFIDCPNIQSVTSAGLIPGYMQLSNPFIGGQFENISTTSGEKFTVYDSTLMRNVTMIVGNECKIQMNDIPAGRYRISVGMPPSPDHIPYTIHPVIEGIKDNSTEVLLDSTVMERDARGRLRHIPYAISNRDKFKYDTIIHVDTIFGDIYESVELVYVSSEYAIVPVIDSFAVNKNYDKLILSLSSTNRQSNHILIDKVFFEPLDNIEESKYSGPFTESVFNNATLYVPESEIETYRSAQGWKYFKNIAINTSVKPVEQGNKKVPATNLIHDIIGRRVLTDSLEQLPPGLYIINGRKALIR